MWQKHTRTVNSYFTTVCLAEIVQKQSYKDNRKKGKISLSVPTPALTWKRKGKARRWETEKREQAREKSALLFVIIADYYQVLLWAHGQPPLPALINNSYINERRTNTAADHHSQTMTVESGLCWLREDAFQQMLCCTFTPGVAHGDQTAELKPFEQIRSPHHPRWHSLISATCSPPDPPILWEC